MKPTADFGSLSIIKSILIASGYMLALAIGLISYLTSLYPYEWDSSHAISNQADADAALFIVLFSGIALAILLSTAIIARFTYKSLFSYVWVKIAFSLLATLLILRLIVALSNCQG